MKAPEKKSCLRVFGLLVSVVCFAQVFMHIHIRNVAVYSVSVSAYVQASVSA